MSKSVFLCYRLTDSEIVDRTKSDLVKQGIDSWSYQDVKPGQSWRHEMNQALLAAEIVVIFLSPSFIENEVCRQQVYVAQSLKKRLIPIFVQLCFNLLDAADEFSQLKGLHILPFIPVEDKGLADDYDTVFPQLIDAIRPKPRPAPLNARHNYVAFSQLDTGFVIQLCEDLGRSGIDTWSTATRLRGGDHWRRDIADAVLAASNLILVVSVESINSYWVRREVLLARLKGIPVIPIIPLRVLRGSNYEREYPKLRDAASAVYEMSPLNDISWIYPEPEYESALRHLVVALAPSEEQKSQRQGIFISYRRSDSRDVTGRVRDILTAQFGPDFIFLDVGSIQAGENFLDTLQRALNTSAVMLVMIGSNWATITDPAGKPRLHDPNDMVRLEVQTALARKDMVVIPVLLDTTAMPTVNDLPESLHELVYRQSVRVRPDPDFHGDMSNVVAQIRLSQSKPEI